MTTLRIVVASVLGGCMAAHPGTHASDMTAAEHHAAAREHSRQITNAPRGPGYGYGSYPWYYAWNPDTEHRELAEAHDAAAERLEAQFDRACAQIPRGLEAESPLDTFTVAVSPMPGGVVFHLAEGAGPPDDVLAQLRCHHAWLMLAPRPGAGDEPLLVAGTSWMTHSGHDGIEVMATVADERERGELARRAQIALERSRAAMPAR